MKSSSVYIFAVRIIQDFKYIYKSRKWEINDFKNISDCIAL